MTIFGWSLPPGISFNDIDPPEEPCLVCEQIENNCVCPECPECGTFGDTYCYDNHGLIRTDRQIDLLAKAEKEWEENSKQQSELTEDWTNGNLS